MGVDVKVIPKSRIWGVDLLIFVTLGTQCQDFSRLIKFVEIGINKGKIREKVIVQAGQTEYESELVEIRSYIPKDEQDQLYKDCSLLITHGGVGSITGALKFGKKVIAVARLKSLNEHINNHQLEIIDKFVKDGYILSANDEKTFIKALSEIDKFKPRVYKSNTHNMIQLLKEYIVAQEKESKL